MNHYVPGSVFPAEQFLVPGEPVQYRITHDVVIDGVLIPKGFEFDGNSAPRIAWWLISRDDCLAAAAVHDFVYRGPGRLTLEHWGVREKDMRFVADVIWLKTMGAHGISPLRATIGYRALRLFGWMNFRRV